MDLLNQYGAIIMDYRRTYKRHYSNAGDEALKAEVHSLYKNGRIPEKLFRILLDETIDDSEVYSYMVSRREYTKSSVELNSEFDVIRERVNDQLIKIGFTQNVCTKNSVNTNRIYVIKQYDVPKSLLLSYFGITPVEIIPLMRRKGFMDKFCVLRLSQAFKEIYTALDVPDHIDHGYSLIYYNKAIQGFSIDYKYMVNINYIMDQDRLIDIMNKIKDVDQIVEAQFKQKMSASYFKDAYTDWDPVELQAEIQKITNIPTRGSRKLQDVRKPQLIVDEASANEDSVLNNKKTEENTGPVIVIDEEDAQELKPDKSAQLPVVSVDEPVQAVTEAIAELFVKKSQPVVVDSNEQNNVLQKDAEQENEIKIEPVLETVDSDGLGSTSMQDRKFDNGESKKKKKKKKRPGQGFEQNSQGGAFKQNSSNLSGENNSEKKPFQVERAEHNNQSNNNSNQNEKSESPLSSQQQEQRKLPDLTYKSKSKFSVDSGTNQSTNKPQQKEETSKKEKELPVESDVLQDVSSSSSSNSAKSSSEQKSLPENSANNDKVVEVEIELSSMDSNSVDDNASKLQEEIPEKQLPDTVVAVKTSEDDADDSIFFDPVSFDPVPEENQELLSSKENTIPTKEAISEDDEDLALGIVLPNETVNKSKPATPVAPCFEISDQDRDLI